MYKFTAADAVNVVNDSVELIKLRSVEYYWLDNIYTMIKDAARRAETTLVLTGYFWTHSSPERTKVIQTLKENGFKIFSVNISKNVYGFDEPKIVISWKDIS